MKILLAALSVLLISNLHAAPKVDWDISVYPENQLFPSMLISTATVQLPEEAFSTWDENSLGDRQGCIGIDATGLVQGAKVEVTVEKNAYMQKSTFTGEVETPAEGESPLQVHPKIRYRYDLLGKVEQAVPLDITVSVKVDGVSLGEKTQTISLRPVNDCLFGVEETDDTETTSSDYTWLFAAYVNEDHPLVGQLLKDGLALDVVDSYSGVQSGDSDEVLKQIFSLWCVLQQRGIKYSDITTNSRQGETVFSQSVRFIDESLALTQANCVDGSVLFASVLRKIGLNPSLILIPGHMFISIPLDDDTTIGLETTMIGAGDQSEADVTSFPENAVEVPSELDDCWQNFQAAVCYGTNELEENADKFKESDDADYDADYQQIDIGDARAIGIMPIARPSGNLDK